MTTCKKIFIIIFLIIVTVVVYITSGDLSISTLMVSFIIMTIKTRNSEWYREENKNE